MQLDFQFIKSINMNATKYLPLSWKNNSYPNVLKCGSSVCLLPNPNNSNEILIFRNYHLEYIYGYDVSNKSCNVYTVPMWPSVLFQEYNNLHPTTQCRVMEDVPFLITNGTKQHTLSIVGSVSDPDSRNEFSYHVVLNTKTWKLEKVNNTNKCKLFPNQTISRVGSTILSYKHYIMITCGLGQPQEIKILDVKNANDAHIVKKIHLTKI